jgi:hypothetical protein
MMGGVGGAPGTPADMSTTGSYQGVPLDMFGRGMSQEITLADGSKVQAGQSYGYLTALANELQGKVSLGIVDPAVLANVQAKIEAIEAQEGYVQTVDGREVRDPTYTAILNARTKSSFGREQTLEFRKKAIEREQRVGEEMAMIDHQADVFTKFPAGALATDKAAGLAILQSLGVPVPADTSEYAAKAQEALKGAAQKLLNSIGTTAPAAEMEQLRQAIESPNMEPGAIKTILSLQRAQAMREADYYKLRSVWDRENPDMAMDQSEYDAWFAREKKFESYYNEAKKNMPIFAGEVGSKQKPYQLSAQVDGNGNFTQADREFENLPAGAYFTTPDGVIKQKPRG